MILPNGDRELWFGLEDDSWPRNATGAIVRYHPDTLAFIGLHHHPSLLTIPWLAFHPTMKEVWTANWTRNYGQLNRFDLASMSWLFCDTCNVTIDNVPLDEFPQSDILWIQGGDIMDGFLYLLSDTYRSTLLSVDLSETTVDHPSATVKDVRHIGLGHEREGLDLVTSRSGLRWFLCLGSQKKTWEGPHYADIVAMRLDEKNDSLSATSIAVGLAAGLLAGLAVGFVLASKFWRKEPIDASTYSKVVPDQDIEVI